MNDLGTSTTFKWTIPFSSIVSNLFILPPQFPVYILTDMKQISVSNKVFGLIWSRATETDESEDDILLRLLSRAASPPPAAAATVTRVPPTGAGSGVYDARSGLHFPQGFTIFRTYKGQDYKAAAIDGAWHLEGHLQPYVTLSALSSAIGAKTENAWLGWRFMANDGQAKFVAVLREGEQMPKHPEPRLI